jgi:hypothetical protein
MLGAAKVFGVLTAICVIVLVVGLPIASAWYADDACPTAEWKCELGAIGFTGVFLGAVGAAAFGLFTLIAGLLYAWRRKWPNGLGAGKG